MELMNWKRSSYSSSNGQNCVEVAHSPADSIAVRDSKNPDDGHLVVSHGAWRNFTSQIKADR
jgi:hypothetical protein